MLYTLLCGSLFYGYNAWKFDRKVRIFTTKIHVGDSINEVRALLGNPSHVIAEYRKAKKEDLQLMKPDYSILWVYSGSLFIRTDLSLIFDGYTQRLIEKKRISHFIE